MTVIIAIPVKRVDGKPYVLMASDSKQTKTETPKGNVISSNENAMKIHRVNNKLIAFAGTFSESFKDIFLKAIKEYSSKKTELKTLTEIAMELVSQYLEVEENNNVDISIRIGEVRNSIPAVSGFNANKLMKEIIPHYHFADMPGFQLIFAGLNPLKHIQEKYVAKIRSSNLMPINVGNYATECLIELADLYPDLCNKKITKEVLM